MASIAWRRCVAAFGLVVAACGGPGSDPGTAPSPPTTSLAEAQPEPAEAVAAAAASELEIVVTPLSAILEPGGEPVDFTAEVPADPGAIVEWSLRDADPEGVVELTPEGNLARVAPSSSVGSAMLEASYGGVTRSVSVTVAIPGSSTIIVPPGSIACGEAGPPGAAVLQRTLLTEKIRSGGFVVSGVPQAGCDGILGRVEDVDVGEDRITVFVQKAGLADAFDQYVTRVVNDVLDARHLTTQWQVGQHCTRTGNLGFEVGVVDAAEIPLRIKPHGFISVEEGVVRELDLGLDITTDLSIAGPLVTITGSGSGSTRCELDLPDISLAPLALGPFTIRPTAKTAVSLTFSAIVEGTTTTRAADVTYQASGNYSVRYSEADGWSNTSSFGNASPAANPPSFVAGDVKATVEADARIGATAALGFGVLGVDQITVDFAEATIGSTATAGVMLEAFAHRVPPPKDEYINPRWGLRVDGSGHLGLDEAWVAFLPCLAETVPELPPDFRTEVFSAEVELGRTPDFVASAHRVPGGRLLTVDGGELTPVEASVHAGTVEFWNITPPAPTMLGQGAMGADGRAVLFIPDEGSVVFEVEIRWVDDRALPPSNTWFGFPGVPGHSYAVAIDSPTGADVSAILDHSLGFCVTGNTKTYCRSEPRLNESATSLGVTIYHNYSDRHGPTQVTVFDLGRGLDYFRAILPDLVFSPVQLRQQTNEAFVPAPG